MPEDRRPPGMIVHVLGRMTAGGNERLCLELLRRAPPGTKQALLTIDPSPHGPLESLFRAIPGLQFFHEPYAPDARVSFIGRVARVLRRLRPRGVVAYSFGLHVFVALAAKVVPGCRVISHVGNPPPPTGPFRGKFARIVQLSRLLGVPLWSCSESVHAQLEGLGFKLPSGSRPMPNGIDIQALRAAAARGAALRVGAAATAPLIGMMARLDGIKDHDTLLRAFAQISRARPNVRLWLGGEGNRRAALEKQAEELGVKDAVSFLGVRQDIGELLGQLDLFAFSTTPAEGFGIALAEAMAVGLPIVATDVPACQEVLAKGECGVLVPPRDPAAMAEKILTLLEDRAAARQLGDAAAARAGREYDISTCAQRYYEHLLGPS